MSPTLSDLRLEPSRLLECPLLFLGGWDGVQGVTTYVLTSPLSPVIVVRSSVDTSPASFIYRMLNEDGVVLPGDICHSYSCGLQYESSGGGEPALTTG